MKITGAMAIAMGASLVAAAGADTEPDNDRFPGDIVPAPLIAGSLADRGCLPALDAEGKSQECEPGEGPDTVLGAFDENGAILATDDDASPLGDGFASALFGLTPNADGSVAWAVSGFDDFDFDGISDTIPPESHGVLGPFALHVNYFDADHAPIESRTLTIANFANGDEVFRGTDTAPAGTATFDLLVDNGFAPSDCEGDRDHYTVTGLVAGDRYVVEVLGAPFDSVLGVLDENAVVLDTDDDSGQGVLSALEAVADAGGRLFIAISGFPDFDFNGYDDFSGQFQMCPHHEIGPYTIAVSPMGCSSADIAPPLGSVNIFDVLEYLARFDGADPRADIAEPFGTLDIFDIVEFLSRFDEACDKPGDLALRP